MFSNLKWWAFFKGGLWCSHPIDAFRIWAVIHIVRLVSYGWERSYDAYQRYEKQSRKSVLWAKYAIYSERVLFPIARRLDFDDENWLGAEMAEQAWWG